MLKFKIGLLILSGSIWAQSQTIKTNLLAPISLYYEFKTNPENTIQLGISCVPVSLSRTSYSDFSLMAEIRHYPKVKRLFPLEMNRAYPSGPFVAPYLKLSRLSMNGAEPKRAFYLGFTTGRKYMSKLGRRKWVFETFGGAGIGTPFFDDVKSPYKLDAFDFRLGISVGKHKRPPKKEK